MSTSPLGPFSASGTGSPQPQGFLPAGSRPSSAAFPGQAGGAGFPGSVGHAGGFPGQAGGAGFPGSQGKIHYLYFITSF